ncbi:MULTISPECIES: hypothetical protein [Moraxella]|uniref:Lipoprotein n=1 Tax=Moraxella nasicaprae TaxID=2904122 RepID=A0ABY6F1S6_9GAMM|nr:MULTISPECIES: hypothetical protein [Moraxella]MDO4895076.1 hypothetical protein [Moraxella sp.]UXZ04049.1 hypothetical protein LU297_05350 [Moraxella nasicaprae]
MKKFILAAVLSAVGSSAFGFCSYSTYISPDDKYNSNGQYLAGAVTKSAAAAILRQNRAWAGSNECGLGSKSARASFEAKVRRGNISPSTIRAIVRGNPWVTVEIHGNSVTVY